MTELKTLRPYFDRLAEDALVGAQGRTRTSAPLLLASQDESADVIVADTPRTPHGRTGRWRLALAVAAAAALIVATVVIVRTASDDGGTVLTPAGPAPSQPTSAPSVPARFPLGAPLVQGPDAASTLLTSWGEFHVGYVFAYGDGRVLFLPELQAALPKDVNGYGIYERHLSPLGLELVLAGQLDLKGLLVGPYPYSRRELWVEPTARLWEPTAYALCPFRQIGGGGVSVNATDVVDELPAPVRAVLDGKQHSYDPSIGTAHWEFPGTASGQLGMTDCFELTAAETAALYPVIEANGFTGQDPIQGAEGWVRVFAHDNLSFAPEPIFPHGQHVMWGG